MRAAVIILAAGSGKRFNSKTPKQFLKLKNKPVFLWSVLAFKKIKAFKQVILVVPRNKLKSLLPVAKKYSLDIIAGGKQRYNSVSKGLKTINGNIDCIAIHDAARPLIKTKTIIKGLKAANKYGASIIAVKAKDTVKSAGSSLLIKNTIPRDMVWFAQTPQIFKAPVIMKAYSKLKSKNITDDAQAIEQMGKKVKIVEGEQTNIKITETSDLKIAKTFLEI
ncbi:2-C-methyl-D-erythritol 4-phosphate cytidylyltransferase [Elusimicrobiota bacterium]